MVVLFIPWMMNDGMGGRVFLKNWLVKFKMQGVRKYCGHSMLWDGLDEKTTRSADRKADGTAERPRSGRDAGKHQPWKPAHLARTYQMAITFMRASQDDSDKITSLIIPSLKEKFQYLSWQERLEGFSG